MKLLLYCTKGKNKYDRLVSDEHYGKPFYLYGAITENFESLNGKIVAECDYDVEEITNCGTSFMIMKYDDLQESYKYTNEIARGSCLDYTDLRRYLGTNNGYAIHIKNLHIFDEPRELRFYYQKYKNDKHLYNVEKAPQNMMKVIGKQGDEYILISIRPEWLCKILNGEKTIEIRKKVLKEMLK